MFCFSSSFGVNSRGFLSFPIELSFQIPRTWSQPQSAWIPPSPSPGLTTNHRLSPYCRASPGIPSMTNYLHVRVATSPGPRTINYSSTSPKLSSHFLPGNYFLKPPTLLVCLMYNTTHYCSLFSSHLGVHLDMGAHKDTQTLLGMLGTIRDSKQKNTSFWTIFKFQNKTPRSWVEIQCCTYIIIKSSIFLHCVGLWLHLQCKACSETQGTDIILSSSLFSCSEK